MQIWLESVDIPLILKAKGLGLLHGVATNLSMLAKSKRAPNVFVEELLKAQKGLVAIEVRAVDPQTIVSQAEELRKLSDRILVKIPTTKVGLEAIHALSGKVPTIASGIYDFNQALLAAKAGANYIAPDYTSICEADIEGIHTIRAMLEFIKKYGLSSQMMASTLRSPEQVKELADMGAHAAALNETVLKGLIEDNPKSLD
jgi:transaldolase